MDEDQGGMPFRIGLPVAVAEDLGLRGDREEPRFGGNIRRQSRSGPESREQRHQVGIREEGVRDKRAVAHAAKSTASGSTTQAARLDFMR